MGAARMCKVSDNAEPPNISFNGCLKNVQSGRQLRASKYMVAQDLHPMLEYSKKRKNKLTSFESF